MKKLLLFLLVFVIASAAKQSLAQNDLVIFSEQGEKFYVVIDGVRQNAKPETNVKVTGLKQPMVTAKIIFDGGNLPAGKAGIPDVDQKIYFQWAGEEKNGFEFSCAVVKKGEVYKIKQRSCTEISHATPPAGQTVVVYSTTPPAIIETTTISTTTTTGAATTGDHVNVGVNMGGVGINMNVNINDPNVNTTSTSSTTMTSTTTTSSSGYSNTPPPPTGGVYVLEGYNGPNNCNWPMSPGDFESAKSSIKAKSFEDSKFTVAKQILGSNCMLSAQVKEIMLVFDFENTRLDFAKFAWGKTFDPGNYYKLNDAFQFESSIDDLNKYIDGHK